MVFKFKTVDFTEDINTIFPYSLPSSPESTICLPLGHTFTRAFGGVRQAAGDPPADYQVKKNKDKPQELPLGLGVDIVDFPYQKQLRNFTYKELKLATDNFSNKNVVGEGSFSRIYKGRLSSGFPVAVKTMKLPNEQHVVNEFRAEMEVGKLVMHRNIIPLIGFCDMMTEPQEEELLLVYPLMANGTLWSHLHKRPESQPPMDWDTRKRIALGVARGLCYLHDHCFCRIIHRDIKPSNILLDHDLEALIADSALAVFVLHKGQLRRVETGRSTATPNIVACATICSEEEASLETNMIAGTRGYIDPDYMASGRLSAKSDVYSFGVMFLELISGRKAIANGTHILHWAKDLVDVGDLKSIPDESMLGNYCGDELQKLIKLSFLCTQPSPAARPNMSEVVSILEGSSLYTTELQDFNWDDY